MIFISYLLTLILSCRLILGEFPQSDWAVKLKGNEDDARRIADENDLDYIGKVGSLDHTFHFREKHHTKQRIKRSTASKTMLLSTTDKVFWVEHQKTLIRKKRSVVPNKHNPQEDQIKYNREIRSMFNDPEWTKEWYLYDGRNSSKGMRKDLNVIPVWKMNITGRGVTVTIVDDGLEHAHPDLKDNYDPKASFDVNDNDNDPTPNLAPGTSNEHGTRCASEIAMTANNNICGVGIAYNSKIGGIRMLDGGVNDVIEAKSLSFNNKYIDIYGASWGPSDDGKSMEGFGTLLAEAIKDGITNGRKGKGNLFVWAAGNGGYSNDSCAADGYVSSMYVISINSIDPDSTVPGYIERCSSTMAATFSSYYGKESKLIVADVNGKCTNKHSGTSAAAPYAAGIFALALEANPNLTWRDIKHLLTWTCQISSLKNNDKWQRNDAGFWVSDVFGFGQIDALNFVQNAKSWISVPEMITCTVTNNSSFSISNIKSKLTSFDGNRCSKNVKYIEHIIISLTFKYSERGALFMQLTSPHGMNTTLLPLRYLDKSDDKMENWFFNTVHNWGEDPSGIWSVSIEDKKNDKKKRFGTVEYVSMTFHGTKTIPNHRKVSLKGKREYDYNFNRSDMDGKIHK